MDGITTKLNRVQLAGLCLLMGGIVSFAGIHIAGFVYPGYRLDQNFVSDLGATCSDVASNAPRDCVVMQPASVIFSLSTDALGVLVLAAAYLLYRAGPQRRLALLLGITGLGALGVGLVSEAYSPWHAVFAFTAFLGAAVAALGSARFLPRSFRYPFVALGCIALVALGWFSLAALALRAAQSGLAFPAIWTPVGVGGMERIVVYPILAWVVSFGAALLALPNRFRKPVPVVPSAAAGRAEAGRSV